MPYYLRILLIVLAVSVAAWALIMVAFSYFSSPPTDLGAGDGRLRPCPDSPNCVCTFSPADDAEHAIAPLAFTGSPDEAWSRLKAVLAEQPRTRVVTEQDGYAHVECTSLVFRFVDDVELLLDRDGKKIHFRSASRAGRSDLGVNRARMEAVRKAFEAKSH